MKIVIDISEEDYNNIEPFLNGKTINGGFNLFKVLEIIRNGIPLPKRHGRLVDIGKIDEDKMESDNPIICLTINGHQFLEAISLDYLNDLPTIIEAEGSDDI